MDLCLYLNCLRYALQCDDARKGMDYLENKILLLLYNYNSINMGPLTQHVAA